jgi:hypothetical protein
VSLNDFRIIPRSEYDLLREGGAFPYSASQVATFRECPRKWFFGSILKLPRPSTGATELGSNCHAAWEAYLQHGPRSLPPKGSKIRKIVDATLRYLPLPGCSEVERDERLDSPFGIGTARIDGLVLRPEDFPQASVPGAAAGVPLVFDHKTTSKLDYAKTPLDLLGDGSRACPGDAQAVLYGVVARLLRPDATDVDLFWSYVSTKNAEAKPVRVRQSLPILQDGLGYLEEDLTNMGSLRSAATALDVPYDQSACDSYGGCPFREHCPAGRSDIDYAAMFDVPSAKTAGLTGTNPTGDQDMSMAALLGLKPAAPAPAPAPAVSTPAPAPVDAVTVGVPVSTPLVPATDSLMDMARALGASPVSAPAVASAPAPEPIPAEETGFEKVPPAPSAAVAETPAEPKRPGRPKGSKKVEVVATVTVPAPAPTVTAIEPGKAAETADAMVASGDDADEEMRLEQALKRACETRRFRRAEILARTLVSRAEIG